MSRQVGRKSSAAVDGCEVAEDLEVGGGKRGANGGPASEVMNEDGQREAEGEGCEQADGEVDVCDRGHACDGGEAG